MKKYQLFLKELDNKLSLYFDQHKEYICCKKGCSLCCEKGDYPISKIVPLADAAQLKKFSGILAAAIPELGPMVGFDQRNPHHAYDLYTHTALVVQQVPEDLTLRWAALLHDTGKIQTFTLDDRGMGHFYGHDKAGAAIADRILRRLKAPAALREQAVLLVSQHMNPLPEDLKTLRRRISRLGWDTTEKLWYLQRADLCSKGADVTSELQRFDRVREAMEQIRLQDACLGLSDLEVNGYDLMELGYQGKEIGACLRRLFSLVLDEKLENRKEILLQAAAMPAFLKNQI